MLGRSVLSPEELDRILVDLRSRGIDTDADRAVDMYAWPQMWSSTALGLGGIGGQAMTVAMVVDHTTAYVYFGGHPAYQCDFRALFRYVIDRKVMGAPSIRVAQTLDIDMKPLEPVDRPKEPVDDR